MFKLIACRTQAPKTAIQKFIDAHRPAQGLRELVQSRTQSVKPPAELNLGIFGQKCQMLPRVNRKFSPETAESISTQSCKDSGLGTEVSSAEQSLPVTPNHESFMPFHDTDATGFLYYLESRGIDQSQIRMERNQQAKSMSPERPTELRYIYQNTVIARVFLTHQKANEQHLLISKANRAKNRDDASGSEAKFQAAILSYQPDPAGPTYTIRVGIRLIPLDKENSSKREIQIQALTRQQELQGSIDSPHVNKVIFNKPFDAKTTKTENRKAYALYELAPYGDALTHLENLIAYDPKNIPRLIKQMVLGLNDTHKMNIVHRDVKLENFVLFEDGYGKWTDFGFAEQGELFSGINGTKGLMAPEMSLDPTYTQKVDVWSIGILAYEIMTGDQEPNPKVHIGEVYYANIMGKCKKPENQPWGDFVMKCLCPMVDQRPTMAELLEHPWMKSVGDVRLNMPAAIDMCERIDEKGDQ